jgi:hypothetical protein
MMFGWPSCGTITLRKSRNCTHHFHRLPKGLETFDLIDGIWVTKLRYAIPLAIALRQALAIWQAAIEPRKVSDPKWKWSTSIHRIETIIEKFTDMQVDLDRERKTMMLIWAKREEQLKGVLDSSAGLYGDLQGIAGRAMSEIEGLGPLMIESKSTPIAK